MPRTPKSQKKTRLFRSRCAIGLHESFFHALRAKEKPHGHSAGVDTALLRPTRPDRDSAGTHNRQGLPVQNSATQFFSRYVRSVGS